MSDTNVYQHVKLHINDASSGQRISVNVSQKDFPVAWSLGPTFTNSGGIKLTSSPGRAVPVSELTVDTKNVVIQTSSGSESFSFTVDLYLVAQAGIQAFRLKHSSDQGPSVHISIGDAHPKQISYQFVEFSWPS